MIWQVFPEYNMRRNASNCPKPMEERNICCGKLFEKTLVKWNGKRQIASAADGDWGRHHDIHIHMDWGIFPDEYKKIIHSYFTFASIGTYLYLCRLHPLLLLFWGDLLH
jgi:hypothetical protein